MLNCFAALGEEIGWRGFLVDRLAKTTTFANVAFISGGIGAVWHMPLILFADYNAGAPFCYSVTCFSIMVIASSFAYAWMRLISGSLWTAMLLHTSHNFWAQGFYVPITIVLGNTRCFVGEFGAALAVVSVFVAYWFWMRRNAVTMAVDTDPV